MNSSCSPSKTFKISLLLLFLFLSSQKVFPGAGKIHDEKSVFSNLENSLNGKNPSYFMLRAPKIAPKNPEQVLLENFINEIKPSYRLLKEGLQQIKKEHSTHLTEENHDFLSCSLNALEILHETIDNSADFDLLDQDSSSSEAFKFSEFNLRNLLDQVKNSIKFSLSGKAVACSLQIHTSIPEFIRGDKNKIRHILINFLGNAFKFTEQGWVKVMVTKIDPSSDLGQKVISWGSENEKFLFEVVNTGKGLHVAEMAKLFKPYAQANETIKASKGGTGLGLNICKDFAKILGGEIGVESNLDKAKPGEQVLTTFWFTARTHIPKKATKEKLPFAKKTVSSPTRQSQIQTVAKISHEIRNVLNPALFILDRLEETEIGREPCFESPKNAAQSISFILNSSIEEGEKSYNELSDSDNQFLSSTVKSLPVIIADDSELQRKIFHRILLRTGFQNDNIIFTASREQLFQKATATENGNAIFRDGVIFSDVRMPNESDGPDAARDILKFFNNLKLNAPIIIGLSGENSEETKKSCSDAGIHTLLLKKDDTNAIKKILVKALHERENLKKHEHQNQVRDPSFHQRQSPQHSRILRSGNVPDCFSCALM